MPKIPSTLFYLPAALALGVVPSFALDLDSNGFPDVWETRYNAANLVPGDDTDSDGFTNAEEAAAGTNPFDPASKLASSISLNRGAGTIDFPTQAGKKYQLLTSQSPNGSWGASGDPIVGDGGPHSFPISTTGGKCFFKIAVSDVDTDGDGVDDWSELQLSVLDPKNAISFPGSGKGDLEVVTGMIQSWKGGITITVQGEGRTKDVTGGGVKSIYESEPNTPAVFTFTRPTAEPTPLVLFLQVSGSTDSSNSSASPGDYTLRNGTYEVTNKITIQANSTSVNLSVRPVADTLHEVPEEFTVSVTGQTPTAKTTIYDAREDSAAHEKLFVSYLRSMTGVTSNGSGLATLRLNGGNTAAVVSVTFTNLNAPVSTVQLIAGSSTILLSVTPPAYTNTWNLSTQQAFVTDQAALNALLNGDVKLRVSSQNHLGGEIEGNFQLADGSVEFLPPPAAPAPATLTGAELDRDIVRFLTQATYGPTQQSVDALRTRIANAGGNRITAYGQWIDEQFNTAPSGSLEAFTRAANNQAISIYLNHVVPPNPDYDPDYYNLKRGWWLAALSGQDQLRQRLAFALSEIFVISDNNNVVRYRSYATSSYYDMLARNSNGAFSTVLKDVSLSPLMGYYLSHLGNRAKVLGPGGVVVSSPDENYAREIMQLFSIGLVQLHPDGSLKLDANNLPIPTYDQNDISEMARVFTGWYYSKLNRPIKSDTVVDNTTFGNIDLGQRRFEAQWIHPMKMFQDKHDIGAKSMIGLSLPAGQTGQKDLDDVIAHLSAHPNTAPFISRLLIQRLVTSNPSRGYIYRASTAFSNSGGNLGATVKAILLDPEARSLGNATTIPGYGKVREPLIRATAFFRAYGLKSQLPLSDLVEYGFPATELAKYPANTMVPRIHITSSIGQEPLNAPSVFNWFQSDYAPPGDLANSRLVSPDLMIANESTLVNATNFFFRPIFRNVFDGESNGTTIAATVGPLVGQSNGAPYNYPADAHFFKPDYSALEQTYITRLDGNGDGLLNGSDPALDDPEAVANAGGLILNQIDLLLCSGHLLGRYGNNTGQPRKMMRDAIFQAVSAADQASDNPTKQVENMKKRIQTALFLVTSSPEFAVQK